MSKLTPRELEVVTLLLDGWSNKEIADGLHVATATIKSHVRNIYRVLGLKKTGVWAPRGKRCVSLQERGWHK